MKAVQEQSAEEFRKSIGVVLAKSAEKKALLFIHGYNLSFAEAARRTAQLAWDLEFRGPGSHGVPLFYSWPSRWELAPYPTDENNAEWAQTDLTTFLEDFLRSSGIRDLYVIAHSMGSRPTLRAITAISKDHPELSARIRQVILAAPDIDADVFRRQIAPAFDPKKLTGTLYVSSKDIAMKASASLHTYLRLGDPAAGPVTSAGLETVDASDVDDGDFLGHSYFAERPVLLGDIFVLGVNGIRAGSRFGLTEVDTPAGRYWKLEARAK